MAVIVPFKGLRYNPEKVDNPAEVVTPPYDVIDAAAQDRYYRRHPYNIIRLEYGKTGPEDGAGDNRYTRAAACFNTWLEERVLLPEDRPALYLYEQEFTVNGERRVRSGFICGVGLEPYEKGVVLPHEETMPKHKADRLELMRACRANFSPIFSLYADPAGEVDRALREAVKGAPPDVNFTDEKGEAHRMWVVTDGGAIGRVRRAMADRRIFIADGHHRYETALNYKREREAMGGSAGCEARAETTGGANRGEAPGGERETRGEAPPGSVEAAGGGPRGAAPDGAAGCDSGTAPAWNYVMMTLVNLYDPGLVVLPTHRLIKNVTGLDGDRLVEQLKKDFTVEEYPLAEDRSNFQEFLKLMAARGLARAAGGFPGAPGSPLTAKNGTPESTPDGSPADSGAGGPEQRPGAAPHRHVFGLYTGKGRLHLLSLTDEEALARLMPEDKSPAWRGLDVSVLHTLIIEKYLGICGELRARAEHITYTREEEGALAAVDDGEYQLAFFLNPTLVEEVTAVAANGEKMPQKSTYFYPKLITGLVVNKL